MNTVRMAQLEGQPLSAPFVFRATRVGLNRCAVTHTDEIERYGKSFRHAGDGVGNESTRRSPHLSLFLDMGILDGDGHCVRLRIGDLDEWLERNGGGSEGACDDDAR